MGNGSVKQVAHQAVRPVSIERDIPDIVVIEGVRYAGDLFRRFSMPESDVLYAVRRDDQGSVTLTVIRNIEQAEHFFKEVNHVV